MTIVSHNVILRLMENTEKNTSSQEKAPEQFDFMAYLSSLALQAMVFLGEIPNPLTNKTEKNLQQAKFLIDTLALLKDKTKGNLESQEENLLNSSLYELQMKYVQAIKGEDK